MYEDNWIPEVGDRFEVKIKEMNCYDCYWELLSVFKFDNFTRS